MSAKNAFCSECSTVLKQRASKADVIVSGRHNGQLWYSVMYRQPAMYTIYIQEYFMQNIYCEFTLGTVRN